MLERAISRESWGEPATEEDRVKAQGNKVNHLGQEEGSLESLEESIGLCAIPSPVGAVRQTPRGAARPQAAFPVGRRRCGYVWKHHPCQVEVGSPEERQREDGNSTRLTRERPCSVCSSVLSSALWESQQSGPSMGQLRIS